MAAADGVDMDALSGLSSGGGGSEGGSGGGFEDPAAGAGMSGSDAAGDGCSDGSRGYIGELDVEDISLDDMGLKEQKLEAGLSASMSSMDSNEEEIRRIAATTVVGSAAGAGEAATAMPVKVCGLQVRTYARIVKHTPQIKGRTKAEREKWVRREKARRVKKVFKEFRQHESSSDSESSFVFYEGNGAGVFNWSHYRVCHRNFTATSFLQLCS